MTTKLFWKIFKFALPVPFIWALLVFLYGSLIPAAYQKNLRYASAGGFAHSRFSEADTTRNIDLLVLGSSHAYRGFDPRIFAKHGIKMFNMGTSAQRTIQTKYLVEEYLDKLRPRMVLFEVSSMNFTGDGLESALDICYSVREPDLDLLEMVFEVNQVKAYNTFLFAVLNSFLGKEPKKEQRMKGDKYISGGYVESNLVIADAASLHEPLPARQIDIRNTRHAEAFEEILALLEERKVPVILVQAPTSEAHRSSIGNEGEIDAYFASFPGVPYYNFNKYVSLDDSCFFDIHHLNQRGVSEFNNALIRKLHSPLLGNLTQAAKSSIPSTTASKRRE